METRVKSEQKNRQNILRESISIESAQKLEMSCSSVTWQNM